MADTEGSEVAVASNTSENGALADADNNAGADGQVEGQEQPAARAGFWGITKTLIVRCLFMYMISSFLRGRNSSTPAPTPGPDGKPIPAALPSHNVYSKDMPLDFYVYISEQEFFTDFNNKAALFWLEEDLVYGDWTGGMFGDGTHEKKGTLKLSDNVINNGSLYIHTYVVKAGFSPDPADTAQFSRKHTLYQTKRLNKYKKRKFVDTVNLLTGETEAHPDLRRSVNGSKMEIINCWHPNLTINLVEDYTPWTPGAIPAPLNEYIEFIPGTANYKPILFFNDYWNLHKDYMPINETTPEVNVTITYQPMSLFKWQMYAAQTMRNKWYSNFLGEDVMGEESDEEQDSLKTTLVETNPYLLAITIVVSLVHSVFEFLAFKNDIQFWRNRKSLEGLSVRSVFFNVFQSLIVVLYIMDNETNFVVRISVVVGLFIEMWKIFKVMDVKLDRENRIFGLPRPTFKDKSTYVESDTKKYDKLAFRYLSWLLFPLLGCYAVYSVMYNEHRGWYSWVLSILYGFLLMFGFIMMTPQLFINYKLKSVAHLPWRMLTYKALNTFIDDLFAFVIKMPTLYRLGCFRDDIVFLIYVYQRYIYPVDKSRVNEYGTSQEMLEGDAPPPEDSPDAPLAVEGAPTPTPAPAADSKESNGAAPSPKPKTQKQKNKKAKKND